MAGATIALLIVLVTIFVVTVIVCCIYNIKLEKQKDDLMTEISRNRDMYDARGGNQRDSGFGKGLAGVDKIHLKLYKEEMKQLRSKLHQSEMARAANRREHTASGSSGDEHLPLTMFDNNDSVAPLLGDDSKSGGGSSRRRDPQLQIQLEQRDDEIMHLKEQLSLQNSDTTGAAAHNDQDLRAKNDEITKLSERLDSLSHAEADLKQAQAQLQKAEGKYDAFTAEKKTEIDELTAQLAELESGGNFDPEGRISSLRAQVQAEKTRLVEHQKTCEHEISTLQASLASKQAERDNTQRDYEQKLAAQEAMIAQKELEVKQLTRKKEQLQNRTKVMKGQLSMSKTELALTKGRLQTAEQNAAKAQASSSSTPAEAASVAAVVVSSSAPANDAAMAAANEEIVDLKHKLEIKERTLGKVKSKYQQIKAELKTSMEAKDSEIASLKEQLSTLSTGGDALVVIQTDLDAQRKQVTTLSKELEIKTADLGKLQRSLDKLSKTLEQTQTAAETDKKRLTSQMKKASDKAQLLETSLKQASAEVEKLNGSLSAANSKERPLLTNNDIKKLQTDTRMKDSELYTLKQNMAEETKAKEALATQLETVTEQYNAATEAVQDLKAAMAQQVLDLEAKYAAESGDLQTQMAAAAAALAAAEAKAAAEGDAVATLQAELDAKNKAYADLEADRDHVAEYFDAEQRRRKKFQMEIEGLKGKVRVYVRVRPFNKKELQQEEEKCVKAGDDMWSLALNNPKADIHGKLINHWSTFSFDQVFLHGRNGSQEEVFDDCSGFGELAFNGVNTCIFAYGQSGTGKTYTMGGVPGSVGLKPRMMDFLFDMVSESRFNQVKISAYMVEIYLNNLEDVFWKVEEGKKPKKQRSKTPPDLKIRVGKRNKIILQGVMEIEFKSAAEAIAYCDAAETKRRVRKTGLNEASSRSHLVFAIMIKNKDLKTGKTTLGKLSLVDLAGSERADKTNVDGLSEKARKQMVQEGVAINQSLQQLKNVFRILGSNESQTSKKKEIVVYRGNTLTELMQDSLGGAARTLMFVNVGPAQSNVEESLDSLRYSTYVNNIKNEIAGADADFSEEKAKLEAIIAAYKAKFGEIEVLESKTAE